MVFVDLVVEGEIRGENSNLEEGNADFSLMEKKKFNMSGILFGSRRLLNNSLTGGGDQQD